MSDQKDKPPMARVVTKALSGTVNVVVAGSAAVAAAALHSIPVLALGGVAYAALVAWDLVNPKFVKRALDKEPVSLPSAGDVHDAATRDAVKSIERSREELTRVIDETPEQVMGHLSSVLASVRAMEEHAASLVKRAEELTRYLQRVDVSEVQKELEKTRARAAGATDAEARKQYMTAAQLREDQLKTLFDISESRERINASLARIAATFEGLPAKIVRLHALDAQAMDSMTGNMSFELEQINTDVAAFEETLKDLSEISNV
jgi:hypothetical protein